MPGKKQIIIFILVLAMGLYSLVSCGESEEEVEDGSFEPTMSVMLVIDEQGFGDNSYNDLCWAGLERARDELNAEIAYIRAGDIEHYEDAIINAVNSESALIICAEPGMAAALQKLAPRYPAQAFAIIDSDIEAGSNVVAMSFNAEQGSFLAGIIAGLSSKNHVVSFIGGKATEAQYKYLYGFEAGVSTANKETQIGVGWTETYNDANAAKKIAVAHGALFSDIVYQCTGNAGRGVVDAGRERGFKVICMGQDGAYLSEDEEDTTVLCSIVKRADVAVFDVVESYINGGFYERGNTVYDLSNGGIDISDPKEQVGDAVWAQALQYKNRIINGEIEIPYNWVSWYHYVNLLP